MSTNTYSTVNSSLRKPCDPKFKFLPILAFITSCVSPAFVIYKYYSKYNNFYNPDYLYPQIALLVIPFTTFLIFPLYIYFLIRFKDDIVKLWKYSNIVFISIITLCGFLVSPYAAVNGLVLLVFFLLYYNCLKRNFKIAKITLKVSLKTIEENNYSIISPLSFNTCLFLISFTLFFATFPNLFMMTLDKNQENPKSDRNIFYTLMGISSIGLIYLREVLFAVGYMYGAGLYNFTSEGSKTVEEDAKNVATQSSYGSACFGALLMTIISVLKQEAKENNEKEGGVLSLILLCFVEMLEELLKFLTSQAYIYSVLYGKSLVDSAKIAWESFRNKGFTRYFSLTIVESLLGFMSFMFSLCFAGVSVAIVILMQWVSFRDSQGHIDINGCLIVMCIFMSLALSIGLAPFVFNSVVAGMSNCQITVNVEDPERFARTYPYYDKITKLLEE